MRPLIERANELVDNLCRRGEVPQLLIEAPTGYGKTVGSPKIFSTVAQRGLTTSFIHVLPLRAIIRDFYLCTLLRSMASNIDLLKQVCGEGSGLEEVRKAFESIGIGINDLAYQMGEHLERLGIERGVLRKEPLFDARYIVTTVDSFLYNLFRIPITEIFSLRKHYAIPRLRIFISGVYFDEAHLLVREEDEDSTDSQQLFTVFTTALETLNAMRVPLIMASATIPKNFVEVLPVSVKSSVYIVRLGVKDQSMNREIVVEDRDFIDRVTSIEWRTNVISDQNVVSKAIDYVESGKRVLVACDTLRLAYRRFRELKEKLGRDSVVIIHGLMSQRDREEALKRIRYAKVVVATSVIEAGVNISLDALITDCTRITSIIQRVGRVCRDLKCEEVEVNLVKDMCRQEVIDFVKNNTAICWRLPVSYGGVVGYRKLLDIINPPQEDQRLKCELQGLLQPLFVSSYDINDLLKRRNYALIRTFLVSVYVGDVSDKKEVSYSDLVSDTITLSHRYVDRLVKSGCICGVVAGYGDYNAIELRKVCELNDIVGRDGGFDLTNYVRRCLVKALQQGALFVGLSMYSRCYVGGEGVNLGVLRVS